MLKSRSRSTGSESSSHSEFVRQLPDNWLRTDTILAVVVAFIGLKFAGFTAHTILEDTNVDIVTAQVFSLAICITGTVSALPRHHCYGFTAMIFAGSLTAASGSTPYCLWAS